MKTLLLIPLSLIVISSASAKDKGPARLPVYATKFIEGSAAVAVASVLAVENAPSKNDLGRDPDWSGDLEDGLDTRTSMKLTNVSCEFKVLRHPTESEVIRTVSCSAGPKRLTQSLALVLAIKNSGIEETGNTGPYYKNAWESYYRFKSIYCNGLVAPLKPLCKVAVEKPSSDE